MTKVIDIGTLIIQTPEVRGGAAPDCRNWRHRAAYRGLV